MELKAYAKINLGLDVIRRREDGYHEVCMIMQNIGIHDDLSVLRIEKEDIVIRTNNAELPVDKSNLIYKAAKLMFDEFNLPGGVDITLTKNIPVAAGLAGGSTDAAATFIAINELFDLKLSKEELMKRGVKIGADVPYCILGGTALSEGIGEILTSLPACPKCTVLIAKPPVGVSTKHVYESLNLASVEHPDIKAIVSAIEEGSIEKVASNLGNVLESVTENEHQEITEIKKMMIEEGAIASLMSGSGPTVFGLFLDESLAKNCKDRIEKSNIAKDIVLTGMVNE